MTTNHLVGCRVKIDRAKKHFNELQAEIRAFQNREPYIVLSHCDLQTREELYELLIVEDIPARWGGTIGDVVHNLRSSFDLLAHDLVRHNGGTPGKHTKFPISSAAQFSKSDIRSSLNGASKRAFALVERLKPYGGSNSALWRLHEIDIVDKHRLLVPVGGAHDQIKWTVAMNFFGELSPPLTMPLVPTNKQFPLENGTILFRKGTAPGATDNNQYHYEFVFTVSFGEGQIFDGESVLPTLKQLIDFTERIIDIFARRIFKCAW